ncbi:putative glycosyltransferase [Xenorhabdus poinarii G6]|uniref:Putative glycosyltransferase n=1 Tax=Xenorhabdus poinarii G6 TaxID=1354304 RepID=A0A068R4N1_9GAMM|nr:glycosyltransferase family 4 protein [Xenorhabdus poinarii]CDG21080.1 putative glycosyltransferase [Xenorhabdus poinarii G6]
MKILHLINLQGFGGAERLFLEYLKNSSFENEILCTSNILNENLISELQSFKINYANRIGSTSIKYPTFLRKIALTKKIEKTKADKTIIWDFVPRLSRKPKNTTIIYYDHGCSWRYPINGRTLDFFNMIDGAIAVSEASKRIMMLRFHPDFIINKIINRLPKDISISEKSINNKNEIILGTASRLVGLKGISVSILAANELISRGINVQLLIAGNGEDEQALRVLVHKLGMENNIIFMGYCSDMSVFYNKVDIYLSTPITEPFGLSCIEALSNAVPVIFPFIDGQPEAVKDGYCGIGLKPTVSIDEHKSLTDIDIDFPHQVYDPINDQLTEPKLLSHVDCADAVERLFKNPDLYESMSKNALKWSKETMNYNLFIKEFELDINNK